jgi:dimethylargininase
VIAVTRDVSPSVRDCELTHLARMPIDYARAAAQHEAYRALLASLGCEVVSIAADDAHPDCVFIEDTAVVFDDVAVITRPGAESRRGEVGPVAETLTRYRRLARIEPPATLDGGDVLVLDDRIFVGLGSRTNEAALAQLRAFTGREVIGVRVDGALHLKTAITRVAPDTLLVNRDWLDVSAFARWNLLDIDPSEPFAANALLVRDTIVYPRAFPRTCERLEARGLDVRTVNADELAKAEGGVTCCCLLLQ